MPAAPPEPIAVLVTVSGQQWPGFALAWRGDRVLVRYSTGVGMQYLHWVDAEVVDRSLPSDSGTVAPT